MKGLLWVILLCALLFLCFTGFLPKVHVFILLLKFFMHPKNMVVSPFNSTVWKSNFFILSMLLSCRWVHMIAHYGHTALFILLLLVLFMLFLQPFVNVMLEVFLIISSSWVNKLLIKFFVYQILLVSNTTCIHDNLVD